MAFLGVGQSLAWISLVLAPLAPASKGDVSAGNGGGAAGRPAGIVTPKSFSSELLL